MNEAEYFLNQMENNYQDDTLFKYYLSAFLCALRSITDYLKEEYKAKHAFPQWFDDKKKKMENDTELVYIKKVRDDNVHKKVSETVTEKAARLSQSVDLVKQGENNVPNEHAGQAAKKQGKTSPMTLRRYFYPYPNVDVTVFCKRQLQKVKHVLKEAEDKFSE